MLQDSQTREGRSTAAPQFSTLSARSAEFLGEVRRSCLACLSRASRGASNGCGFCVLFKTLRRSRSWLLFWASARSLTTPTFTRRNLTVRVYCPRREVRLGSGRLLPLFLFWAIPGRLPHPTPRFSEPITLHGIRSTTEKSGANRPHSLRETSFTRMTRIGVSQQGPQHAKQTARLKFHCRHCKATRPPALAIRIHLTLGHLPASRLAILPYLEQPHSRCPT